MLRIGDKEIAFAQLGGELEGATQTVVLNDCYKLEESFNNLVKLEWVAEDEIEPHEIEIKIYEEGNSQDSIKGSVVTLRHGQQPYSWNLPRNYVGLFQIITNIGNKELFIEVEPRKVDRDTFLLLKNNLRDLNIGIYEATSPANTVVGAQRLRPFSNLREQLEALRKDMRKLSNIVDRISDNPKKRIVKTYHRAPLALVANADDMTVYDICSGGSLIECREINVPVSLRQTCVRGNRAVVPETALSPKATIDYNVFENQLLKRFLRLIALNMTALAAHSSHSQYVGAKEECEKFRRDALRMSRLPFLDNVSESKELTKNTIGLRRDVQYIRFYEIFVNFISRPFYDRSDILNIGIAKLWRLYEVWCAAFVTDALLELLNDGWIMNSQKYLKTDELGYMINPDKEVEMLRISRDRECVTMTFQHNRPSFVRKPKRPDITLQYRNDDCERHILLDPKYRSNLVQGYSDNSDRSAVDDMHIYRDAIRKSDGARVFNWATILYPGEHINESFGLRNEWKDGSSDSGISVFCLRPQHSEDDNKEQKRKLLDVIRRYLFDVSKSYV